MKPACCDAPSPDTPREFDQWWLKNTKEGRKLSRFLATEEGKEASR